MGLPSPRNSLCVPVPSSDICDLVSRPDSTASSLLLSTLCLFSHGRGTAPSPAWAPGSEAPAERVSSTQEAGTPHSPHPPQVPEIIKHVYHHMPSATDATAQETIWKVLHVLAQAYTDEVVLTLFEMDEQSQRWVGSPGRQTSPRLC